MRELYGIKIFFTMFGNYINLTENEEKIVKPFFEYKTEKSQVLLENNVRANKFRFIKGTKAIVIAPGRIDIEYSYMPGEQGMEDFLNHVEQAIPLLNQLGDIKGYRIALNNTSFVHNKDETLILKCNELFNITNLFGKPAEEVNVRINHVTKILNEDYNALITILDGNVTNNLTREMTKSLFINQDINSMANNRTFRFNMSEAFMYIYALVKVNKERALSIQKYLD